MNQEILTDYNFSSYFFCKLILSVFIVCSMLLSVC